MSGQNPTIEELRGFFNYHIKSGTLTWADKAPRGATPGAEAGTLEAHGYRRVSIGGRLFRTHRIVWAVVTGAWPEFEVDHINGIRDDNRMCNLKAVTSSENSRNMKRFCTNTSGVAGVAWMSSRNKWRARIQVEGIEMHLGLFDNLAEAARVRKAAEIEHNFHTNHGRV